MLTLYTENDKVLFDYNSHDYNSEIERWVRSKQKYNIISVYLKLFVTISVYRHEGLEIIGNYQP